MHKRGYEVKSPSCTWRRQRVGSTLNYPFNMTIPISTIAAMHTVTPDTTTSRNFPIRFCRHSEKTIKLQQTCVRILWTVGRKKGCFEFQCLVTRWRVPSRAARAASSRRGSLAQPGSEPASDFHQNSKTKNKNTHNPRAPTLEREEREEREEKAQGQQRFSLSEVSAFSYRFS